MNNNQQTDQDQLELDWQMEGGALSLTLKLDNFAEALEVVNQIGQLAEEHNHHPDLHLTNYNQLRIQLITHDSGELTEKDYQLAQDIEQVLGGK